MSAFLRYVYDWHVFMADMIPLSAILEREYQTVVAMVRLYCRKHHRNNLPCQQCQSFLGYVRMRLDLCPYGEQKPTCNTCPVHCYKSAEKQLAQDIMRFAGPRMLWHHPIMAVRHLWHERSVIVSKPRKNQSNRRQRHKEQNK